MSPRKSGHWASLQQAMAPVQNQEENTEVQPVQETVEDSVVPTDTSATNADLGPFFDDDFEIPTNAFSLFDDEEKASGMVDNAQNTDDSQDTTEELLLGETEEPPAKESESKWVVSSQSEEVASNSLDDDFEIPANAFSLYDDEEEVKPAPKRPAKEKKSNKPVSEKSTKKEKVATKAESATPDKSDKVRKPRREKKDKNPDSLDVEQTTTPVAPEHVCEAIATGELDESVVHFAEVQTPVFYPVHQTEVAPVVLPEQTVATEVAETQWSATSLLDELIPDSEIDRVNQKSTKANSADKKTSKKNAKAESKAESKSAKTSKKPVIEDDDDIPFDIPANAFSLPDYKVHLDTKKSEAKSVVDKKREKCAKAESIQEVSKHVPLPEEDDFDIPADAFSMFDDEEKLLKPVQKARPAKPVREPKPVREERSEKEVREPRPVRRREPVYDDESDEYPAREERRTERVTKPVRRPAEEMEEEDVQPVRKSREVRDGEVRRPAINIPSWRDVMDVLIDMNLNRRRETERPSRTARGPRNSDAFKPENYDDFEETYERQDRNNAPRRRQRRPE